MSFKVAAAQYPITAHDSFEDWQRYVGTWVKEATDNGATLLVFPEFGAMELVSIMAPEIQRDLKLQVQEMDQLHEVFLQTYRDLAQKYKCTVLCPSLPIKNEQRQIVNRAYLVGPSGGFAYQEKHHMTRFEEEQWGVESGDEHLQVFETPFADIGVNICFDVEFPEAANALAKNGVKVLLAPSCTEGVAGATRVHIGARARALENQYYVIVSQTVGQVDWCEAVDKNTGYAAVYGPPDVGFPEDGIIARGNLNEPGWLYAEIDLAKVDYVRTHGQVFNFKYS